MNGNVLIVDDDSGTREVLFRYLERCGYACTVAEGFEEARRKLSAADFHVVVTDKNMPSDDGIVENGLALIRHIRHHHPTIGVIVITGFATTESAIEAMRLGAFDYIAKPFDLELLRGKVDRIREYQQTHNAENIMHTYRLFLEEMLELYERSDRTTEEKKKLFLALIQEKIDVFFERFKILERILIYQRERLAEIASYAGQALDEIPQSDPVFPLIVHIAEEAGRRL